MPGEEHRVAVVTAQGVTLDHPEVKSLERRVREARQAGAERVVVEVSTLQHAPHDGIVALLAWVTREHDQGLPALALAGATGTVLRAICQTRLQRELDVYSNREAAVRDVGTP